MNAELDLDPDHAGTVYRAVRPDLTDSDRASFTTTLEDDTITVTVNTSTLGVLRGCLNTVTRLTKLSSTFTGDQDE